MMLEPCSALGGRWGVATALDGPFADGVVIQERADLGSVVCTAPADPARTAPALGRVLRVALPMSPGAVAGGQGRSAVWLNPRAWLLVCDANDDRTIAADITAAFSRGQIHATVGSDALCWLEVIGAGAEDALRQGSFISLAPGGLAVGHARHTLLAGIRVLVHRTQHNGWRIAVERSRARYLVDWFACGTQRAVRAPLSSGPPGAGADGRREAARRRNP